MEAIEAVRAFLASQYLEIDPTFDGLSEGLTLQGTGWLWVDVDLEPTQQPTPHGLLLDHDVGVAQFLLRFRANSNGSEETAIRAQVARAMAYRSHLLPQRLKEIDADANGSWRVILNWLVDELDAEAWYKQASDLRRDTSHLEELPVDAVIRHSSDDWATAVRNHGLPRLLLRTRRILRMASTDAVLQWSSADERVRDALHEFASHFSDDADRRLAKELEARLATGKGAQDKKSNAPPAQPTRLRTLSVRDFRNLQKIDLYLSGDSAQSTVIHGPNGTGKSNLFEALEFALRGTSRRAQEFLGDTDVSTTKKAREYLEQYLVPIGRNNCETKISLNSDVVHFSTEPSSIPELTGNLLFQDQADYFINMKAGELATQIMGEFSGLADDLRGYAEDKLAQGQGNLKTMLARLGLDRSGAITKQETARARVAELELRGAVSQPAHLLALLHSEAWSWSPTTAGVIDFVALLQPERERFEEFGKVMSKAESETEMMNHIHNFLMPVRQASAAADQFLASIVRLRSEFPPELSTKIDLWGRWMAARQPTQSAIDNQDLAKKQLQRKKLADESESLTRQGNMHRERERHFEALQNFLHGPWQELGEQRCPTCNTDFADRGGILRAIEAVRAANVEALELRRKQYISVRTQLETLDKDLQVLDQTRCPLTDADQAAVRVALAPHLPVGVSLDDMLVGRDERDRCLAWVDLVGRMPVPPQFVRGTNEDDQIETSAETLKTVYRDLETGFELPQAWKRVTDELRERLARVLHEHLPETLGGLWRELIMNLTPAPWQMLGDLGIQVESRRAKQEARLVLDTENHVRLARYVLNKAETHALGVGWFLVRYLTHGRFRCSVLALDDPALDMDQTTFRDFCRLLESLLRLHRTRSMPLALIVLLHQDERALDAARATGGILHRLEWNAGEANLARSIRLFGEEFRHPRPTVLFGQERPNRQDV